jgi:hypothetical protein
MKLILVLSTVAGLLAIIAGMPPPAQTKAPPKMTKLVSEAAQSLVTAPHMALTVTSNCEAVVSNYAALDDPGGTTVAALATGSYLGLPRTDYFAGRTLGHQALEETVPAADLDYTGAALRTFSSSA